MNVVDSSGWLEYLADGPNAGFFAPAVEKVAELVVPTISIYEVFKRALQQRDEATALKVVTLMHQGEVVNLTAPLAIDAARLSRSLALPMADSICWRRRHRVMRPYGLRMLTSKPSRECATSRRQSNLLRRAVATLKRRHTPRNARFVTPDTEITSFLPCQPSARNVEEVA